MPAHPLSDEIMIETLRVYEQSGKNAHAAAKATGLPQIPSRRD